MKDRKKWRCIVRQTKTHSGLWHERKKKKKKKKKFFKQLAHFSRNTVTIVRLAVNYINNVSVFYMGWDGTELFLIKYRLEQNS
jgi:hypothetical protein